MPTVDERTADCDGLRIRYLAAGEPGDPPVVLLHGGSLDSARLSWKRAIPAFAGDFRVVAPDWPGYGGSDPPDAPVTTGYYRSVLERLLDALELESANLVGVSMGGGVVLGFALDDPSRVEQLVLVDSYGLGGAVPGGSVGYVATRLGLTGLAFSLLRRSRRATALALRSAVAGTPDDELVSEVYDEVRRRDQSAWIAFQRNEVGPRRLRTNYVDRLPDLPVPTLIIHGENDPLVPVSWAVRAGTLIPNAEVRVLPNCGHWPPREKPEAFAELVRAFL